MGGRSSAFYENRNAIAEERIRNSISKLIDDPESSRNDYKLFNRLKTFGVSTRQSTDSCKLPKLQPHQEQLSNLSNKYRELTKIIPLEREVQFSKHRSTEEGLGKLETAILPDGKFFARLSLSSLAINNPEKYAMYKTASIHVNQSVEVEQEKVPLYTTTHEFGHLIEENIFRERYNQLKDRRIDYVNFTREEADRIKNEVVNICKNKYNNDKIYLSNYANRGGSFEWFAETFTNLELSKNPREIALALGEYLKLERRKHNEKLR